MGRMFRIITGNSPEHTHDPVEENPVAVDCVPFVEVGGPEGVITSIPKPAARVSQPTIPSISIVQRPLPEPVPQIAEEPEVVTIPDPHVLSVAFHRFPKAGLRLLPGGIASDVVAYHCPEHPVATEYRAVRDEIRNQFEEPASRILLFTAAAPVSGTTTVILNFAVALAQEGHARVLVVDANLDRPSVARRLGVAETPGLAEVLGQTIPLAWALQSTAIEQLHVLSAGIPGDGTNRTMSSDFPRLLAQLRQWFDWVLVDGGVWEESLGQDSMGPACDAVYLVTRQVDIDRPEFAGLRASIGSSGGVLRGYITTRN